MELVSLCPFRSTLFVWQPRPSAYSLLVVCKGTFELSPGVSRIADEQEYPNEEDNHWDDDPKRSVYCPTDLVPMKTRADVLVVGHAFAPNGQEVESIVARIGVGDVAKSIEVWTDRAWTAEPQLRLGSRMTKGSLRYERASGGPGTENPAGVIQNGDPDPFGMVPIPQLQPPGLVLSRKSDRIPTIGLGPIAPWWPSRADKLGRHASSWDAARWHLFPLPTDIDPSYFNAAPTDQQTSEIRPDERIDLLHLHPDVPHLVTTLPGTKPRVYVERPGLPPEEILMRGDTLWIDTDRQIATVTWRGHLALPSRDEAGRVLIAMEQPGRTLSFREVLRLAGLPAASSHEGVEPDAEWIEPEESHPALPAAAVAAFSEADHEALAQTSAHPHVDAPVLAITASGLPALPLDLIGHHPLGERWGSGADGALHARPMLPPHDPAEEPQTAEHGVRAPQNDGAEALPYPGAARALAIGVEGAADATPIAKPLIGAWGAAAPGAAIPSKQGRETIAIAWADGSAPAAAARGLGAPGDDASAPQAAILWRALVEAAISDVDLMRARADASSDAVGCFTPPALVVSGELAFRLDPVDHLRALITAGGTAAPEAERTAGLVAKATRLLSGPLPDGAAGLARRLVVDLEGALYSVEGGAAVLAEVRQALAAQRRYERRALFGGAGAMARLVTRTGVIPAFIPEAALAWLPLEERFTCRALAEVHPRAESAEPLPWILRILAVARSF